MNRFLHLCCFVFILLITSTNSCYAKSNAPSLSSITLIDRNGFAETISTPDRLANYQNIDFLKPQSYQKVLRVYNRNKKGDIPACLTSYHPNGQIRQFLQILNNRAQGRYFEWHTNGATKIQAIVIGGTADLDPTSQRTWLFDGHTYAWDHDKHLLADIPYQVGELHGIALYYHTNGKVWKRNTYNQGKIEGCSEVLLEDGSLFQTTEYKDGKKEGPSRRYWEDSTLAVEEHYYQGLLQEGTYIDKKGMILARVDQGKGFRALFGKSTLGELQEYRNGKQEGAVKIFAEDGSLIRTYHVKDSLKEGTEIEYYLPNQPQSAQPKLLVNWVTDKIQGVVKTWYEDGHQESQREMSENKKNGLLTAWYPDGSIMMIESYDHDSLVNGDYYRPEDQIPVTTVRDGKGIASFFDIKGHLIRKINYSNKRPLP